MFFDSWHMARKVESVIDCCAQQFEVIHNLDSVVLDYKFGWKRVPWRRDEHCFRLRPIDCHPVPFGPGDYLLQIGSELGQECFHFGVGAICCRVISKKHVWNLSERKRQVINENEEKSRTKNRTLGNANLDNGWIWRMTIQFDGLLSVLKVVTKKANEIGTDPVMKQLGQKKFSIDSLIFFHGIIRRGMN